MNSIHFIITKSVYLKQEHKCVVEKKMKKINWNTNSGFFSSFQTFYNMINYV